MRCVCARVKNNVSDTKQEPQVFSLSLSLSRSLSFILSLSSLGAGKAASAP